MKDGLTFAQIMEAMDSGTMEAFSQPKSAGLHPVKLEPADSLDLSVQGSRRLGVANSNPAKSAHAEMVEKKADFQGNKVKISTLASSMARDLVANVAWETPRNRVWPQKPQYYLPCLRDF